MEPLVHPSLGPICVSEVPERATLPLRQQVLRPHQRVEDVALGGEETSGALNFAALTTAGEIVGTAWVALEGAPEQMAPVMRAASVLGLTGRQWRLRCMATRSDARGAGVGALVLGAVLTHVGGAGGGLLWCNARVAATGFYLSQGFEIYGEEWEEEHIGPHVLMWRLVEEAS